MTFDNAIDEFAEVAEAARELAKAFFNTGEFPADAVAGLQSYYDAPETRRDLLIALNQDVMLEANPFEGSYEMTDPFNMWNVTASCELEDVLAEQVTLPTKGCYVESKEYQAIQNALARADTDPECRITVFKIMPERLPAREAFKVPSRVLFSRQMADQELEFADMEGFEAKLAAAKVPANQIFWDSTCEVLGRGFLYDPRD